MFQSNGRDLLLWDFNARIDKSNHADDKIGMFGEAPLIIVTAICLINYSKIVIHSSASEDFSYMC